ncbi:hypothetical protein KC727_00255 [Candidatus Kaiserbacteria bacterium]|nr:hypothetical protein [Candidatus Kaiserbacteria bacterium]
MKKYIHLFVLTLLIVGGATTAEAGKSTTWSLEHDADNLPDLYGYTPNLWYENNNVPLSTVPECDSGPLEELCQWSKIIRSWTNVSVTYKVKLTDVDTGVEISDGAEVPIGTRLRIERDTSTLDTDISWFGYGKNYDSPYGRWVTNAGPLALSCNTEDYVDPKGYNYPYGTYVLLNVAPPTTSVVETSDNLSCSGNTCTVTGGGEITIGLNFADTTGRFYSREYVVREYYDPTYDTYAPTELHCWAGNVPLSTSSQGSAYDLDVPTQTLTYTLSALADDAENSASCSSVSIPSNLTAGESFSGSVTVQNTGNTTWTSASSYRLASVNPANNTTWGTNRVNLSTSVDPGESTTLGGTFTAPTTPGTYSFSWQMIQETDGVFGDSCTQSVTVEEAATPICSPAKVANSTYYTGDDSGLSVNTTAAYSTSNTSAKCEFVCNSGYSWDGSACVVTPVSSGSIQASDCTIAVYKSSCNNNVTWSSSGLTSPSVYRDGYFPADDETISYGGSGNITDGVYYSGYAVDINGNYFKYPATVYTLKDGNNSISSDTAEANCAPGTVWSGQMCSPVQSYPDLQTSANSISSPAFDSSKPGGIRVYDNPSTLTFSGTVLNTVGSPATPSSKAVWADLEFIWNSTSLCAANQSADAAWNIGGPWYAVPGGWSADVSMQVAAVDIPPNTGENHVHCYRVVVDRDNLITETNEVNNAGNWGYFQITNRPQCTDGVDNDGDGKIDLADLDCSGPNDDNEDDVPQCSDGIDNDGDGHADLSDLDCSDADDDNETNAPECSDGTDNDGDGYIDYPNDTSCGDTSGSSEGGSPSESGDIWANGFGGSTSVTDGESVTITWDSNNADYCEVPQGGWSGLSDLTGEDTGALSAASSPYIYTLECGPDAGDTSVMDAVTIVVTPVSGAPSITADRQRVAYGDTVNLAWSVSDPLTDSCTVSGFGFTAQTVTADGTGPATIYGTTTYTIDCGVDGSDSVTVDLDPALYES